MKRFLTIVILFFMIFVFDTKIFGDSIYNLYDKYVNDHKTKIVSNEHILNKNKYYTENLSSYVKETDNYTINNKEELLNIYYTAINKGFDKLTFYCTNSYYSCMDDINNLDKEENNFSYINQLVNTFNTYSTIESTYSSNGRVDIKINKKYSEEDIKRIDEEINNIIIKLDINSYSDINDKIKVFHDYIAGINKYDSEMAEKGESKYHSDSAIGTLFEGKSICSGYTDTMSIFLDKLNIKNTRIATEKHVWNAVYLDNKWYHIDLTWDDPVTSDGRDIILYHYYMLDTDELLSKDDEDHNFNKEVYNFIN